ncbi:cupin domain-containing protein [Bacillaceae bacterium SIJ1]|uniref:cupin domain-containing protein n=1 Tax=Litoribacterium kuwaitense TaxID=1398745 RepID=UPI0013EAA3D9|nr:cupin domain-containing protein [Litoribacterium kuwaitense]NGP44886.1 cupin domain-containing protein [Litoribacterium kuwaitense]
MYQHPYTYAYPYSLTSPTYQVRDLSSEADAILEGIKEKAQIIDLHERLAECAPTEQLKKDMLTAAEVEKEQLTQLKHFYTSQTRTQPSYEVEPINFSDYREGLEKGYEAAINGYNTFFDRSLTHQHSPIRNVLARACHDEMAHAQRFFYLSSQEKNNMQRKDYGGKPYVVDIEEATKQNKTFRTALWTGDHLQVTLMSIPVGEDIGLEIHPNVDQFLRIGQGQGLVQMGDLKEQLTFERKVYDDYAIMIPAGKWHNLTNTGRKPLKLYSIYAPPEHPFGTVHRTKADAIAAEANE